MSLDRADFDALVEGYELRQIDEREKLAELALNLRYTIHVKKADVKKVFDKQKEVKRINKTYHPPKPTKIDPAMQLKMDEAVNYWRNKSK